jgi:hypothetical protein
VTGQAESREDGTVAAVLRLADLAGKIERVDGDVTRRTEELAQDCAATQEQVDRLSGALGTLTGQAEDIELRLADMTALLGRMSAQISALASPPGEVGCDDMGYRVNPAPPWWQPADQRCQDTADRVADWVQEVYRPVYGYLADLLPPCWRQHPLCLAYLDVLHEAWCLLYLQHRDPKMVFAQLDWLTRSLLQAAEVMANETKRCRNLNRHCDPGQDARPFPAAPQLNTRR